jgi:quinol monooxygenase YgiN
MTVEWLVPVAQARSMSLALHALAASTRSNQGLLACAVSTDFEHQGRVSYVEEWATEADLRRRIESPSFNQLATLIDDVSRPPRIEFTLGDLHRCADFVREVRTAVKETREARAAGDQAAQPVRKARRRAAARVVPLE